MASIAIQGSTYTPTVPAAFVLGGPSPIQRWDPSDSNRYTLIAGEAIAAGDCVYVKAADGKAWKCPVDLSTKFFGMAVEPAIAAGNPVTVVNGGVVIKYLSAAASCGTKYYQSDADAGRLQTTANAAGVVAVAVPNSGDSGATTTCIMLTPRHPGRNLTAVPASFADLVAVRTYLATLVSELGSF
jgi:hypothetical protein